MGLLQLLLDTLPRATTPPVPATPSVISITTRTTVALRTLLAVATPTPTPMPSTPQLLLEDTMAPQEDVVAPTLALTAP